MVALGRVSDTREIRVTSIRTPRIPHISKSTERRNGKGRTLRRTNNQLASLFRDTLRQFFHGSIEKTRCHNQTGRQFRVLVALNYPAHVQFQSANFLEEFDDVNGVRIRYRSIGVHVPTLLPVTQSLKSPRLGPGWPIIGMFRGSH